MVTQAANFHSILAINPTAGYNSGGIIKQGSCWKPRLPNTYKKSELQVNNKQLKQSGFTLIEIMVVVVIIGMLAAVVGPRVFGNVDKANIAKVKSDIRGIESALNLYRLDNFNYPSTDQGLDALVNQPGGAPEARNWAEGGYMQRIPNDPWGNPYQYLSPGEQGEIDIYTLGKDGASGGTGSAADLSNWDLD